VWGVRCWGGGYWGKICFYGERDLDGQPCTQTNQPCTQTDQHHTHRKHASLQRVAFPVDRSYSP